MDKEDILKMRSNLYDNEIDDVVFWTFLGVCNMEGLLRSIMNIINK